MTIGGAEVQAAYLLNKLDRSKFEIYVAFLYNSMNIENFFFNKYINIIHFNKKSELDIFVYFKILNFIRKNKIDIVQTFLGNHHAYIPSFFYNKIKCILGIRATSTRKGFFLDLTRYKLPLFILKFRDLIFVSNSIRGKNIYASKGIPYEKILLIENGIDLKKFNYHNNKIFVKKNNKKNEIKKLMVEFNINEKDFIIGMVGRLLESKNQILLVNIIYKIKTILKYSFLRKKYPKIKLMIVGDGPYKENLVNKINELNLDKHVILTGNRNDVYNILGLFDIFAFPSLFPEGWPNVIGEAMALGLPIIAYNKGDIKEIINNNYDGIVIDCDENIFEEKLVELILNEKLRRKLSKNAIRSVKRFDLKLMVKKYENLYINLYKGNTIIV